MKYTCNICEYTTERKYRYDRHLQTEKHSQKTKVLLAARKEKKASSARDSIYKCKWCGKTYNHSSSLARHNTKHHKGTLKVGKYDELREELVEMKREFEKEKSILTQEIRKLKEDNKVPQITNYNFIQQNFGNAPALRALDLDDEEFALFEDEDEFMDRLEHHYNNNMMENYLGDYVIRKYKKENPGDQAMWNTDKTRHNYMIRDMIDEDGPYWCEDASAREIKRRVIRPLLKKIDNLIRKRMNALHENNASGSGSIQKALKRMQKLAAMQTEAKYDNMSQKIIRYITPVFHLDQGILLLE